MRPLLGSLARLSHLPPAAWPCCPNKPTWRLSHRERNVGTYTIQPPQHSPPFGSAATTSPFSFFFFFLLSLLAYLLLTFPPDSSIITAEWPIKIPRSTITGPSCQAPNNCGGSTGGNDTILLTWLIALTTLSLAYLIYTASMDSGGKPTNQSWFQPPPCRKAEWLSCSSHGCRLQ